MAKEKIEVEAEVKTKKAPAKKATEVKEKKAPVKKAAAPKAKAEKAEVKEKKAPVKKVAAPKAKTEEVEVKEEKVPAKKATAKKAPAKKVEATSRLRARYIQEIVPAMMEKFKYSSVMEVPFVEKIVINIGVGDATTNAKLLDDAVRELGEITGQKPVVTKAKKSVASFKLREGQAIGCKVTLRGVRMYEFLDRLISIALPRVRDFRGVSKNAFDGRGNYTLGVKEQLIFPEIDYDKVSKIRGMDIVIVTTATTDEEAMTLLNLVGMPFQR